MTIKKQSVRVGLLLLVYRVLLDIMYINWVNSIYAYRGFLYELNLINVVISYVALFIFIVFLPKEDDRVSYMVLQTHFIIMIIPLLSVYAMANLSTKFMVMLLVCFGLEIYLVKVLPLVKIRKVKGVKYIIIGALGFITIVTYYYLLRTQRINFIALNFTTIYEIRSEQKIDLLFGYLITWQYRVINPALIVMSYLRKKYLLTFTAIGMQVMLYLMVPHKEIILSIVLIAMTLYVTKKQYRFDSFLIGSISLFSIVSIYIYKLFNNLLPFAIIPVRLLYVPALIKFQHYRHFMENEKLYYSEGVIGKIFGLKYPYSVPSGFVVSGGVSNSNTGYLAYGYDNLGFWGMILISIIFVLVLLLIDSLTKRENRYIVFVLTLYSMIILNDGDLLTLLLTGGLFLLILILWAFYDIKT